jgi:adenosylmethionine---8-amino-7-oxononanoate aminotransferase
MADSLAQLDQRYVWHPFTQMRDWAKTEPIVIVEGQGAVLRDSKGREYLDANSSIWTNLHGHNHPKINAAVQRQLGKIAHSSALGFASEPASLLAARLVELANGPRRPSNQTVRRPSNGGFAKVFFSDNGSTAMEVALKLAYEFTRRTRGPSRPRFLSLKNAYHGDTIGAVSLGHVRLFHKAYSGMLFKTGVANAPYCYRCPFNRAAPDRADAREYRRCGWECLDRLELQFSAQSKAGRPYTAFVFEPLMQGAAGMIPQPTGWLGRAAAIARAHGALLLADEVMTGFGRMGADAGGGSKKGPEAALFACQLEGVRPDFMAVAKGLTGGYVPMAATLTTQPVFDAFLGDYSEFKTFFHGHSFTGNQVGAAASLASLQLLQSPSVVQARRRLERALRAELQSLWSLSNVGDIRQAGLVAGIELVRDWRRREPFPLEAQAGIRVCEAMAKRGVLTRSIGNVLALMPPYCTTLEQLRRMTRAMADAVSETLGK